MAESRSSNETTRGESRDMTPSQQQQSVRLPPISELLETLERPNPSNVQAPRATTSSSLFETQQQLSAQVSPTQQIREQRQLIAKLRQQNRQQQEETTALVIENSQIRAQRQLIAELQEQNEQLRRKSTSLIIQNTQIRVDRAIERSIARQTVLQQQRAQRPSQSILSQTRPEDNQPYKPQASERQTGDKRRREASPQYESTAEKRPAGKRMREIGPSEKVGISTRPSVTPGNRITDKQTLTLFPGAFSTALPRPEPTGLGSIVSRDAPTQRTESPANEPLVPEYPRNRTGRPNMPPPSSRPSNTTSPWCSPVPSQNKPISRRSPPKTKDDGTK